MKRVTTAMGMAILLLNTGMNSAVLYADELLSGPQEFVADEARQQWFNGRTGVVEVHGALLSSPCTLRTNSIELPLPVLTGGHRVLSVDLRGCGYGDVLTSAWTPAGRSSFIKVSGALQPGAVGKLLPAPLRLQVPQAILRGGDNRITWYLSNKQQLLILNYTSAGSSSGVPLLLRLVYE